MLKCDGGHLGEWANSIMEYKDRECNIIPPYRIKDTKRYMFCCGKCIEDWNLISYKFRLMFFQQDSAKIVWKGAPEEIMRALQDLKLLESILES